MSDAAERERLTNWVRDFGDGLQRFLHARVGDEHAAADLVQEVFFRAWRKRRLFDSRDRDKAFLFCIADRVACDYLRRRPRRASIETMEKADFAEPINALLRVEEGALVRKALRDLSDAQQRTLLLRFFSGMSFRDIADAMESPLGTVLSHCRRGLEQLRESLAGELA